MENSPDNPHPAYESPALLRQALPFAGQGEAVYFDACTDGSLATSNSGNDRLGSPHSEDSRAYFNPFRLENS
jgi:hypothetical protein